MTAAISFRPKARLDLKGIYRHIAEYNPPAASGVILGIYAKLETIASTPALGQGVPHLSPGLRRFPCGNYLIFYRMSSYGIDVVRILHAARDIEAIFRDDLF